MRRPIVAIYIGDPRAVALLERLVDQMAATQADIDALTARIAERDAQIGTALDGIKSDLDALKAANPALDLSALSASVDALDAVATRAAALDQENPAPVVEPAPAPVEPAPEA